MAWQWEFVVHETIEFFYAKGIGLANIQSNIFWDVYFGDLARNNICELFCCVVEGSIELPNQDQLIE